MGHIHKPLRTARTTIRLRWAPHGQVARTDLYHCLRMATEGTQRRKDRILNQIDEAEYQENREAATYRQITKGHWTHYQAGCAIH